MEVNVTHDQAHVLLELTTTQSFCRVALMQQSHTLKIPELSTYITTFSNRLWETSPRIKTPWSTTNMYLMPFPRCISLRHWPPTYLLPMPLHIIFCFCHIFLWLPCVILLATTFPFHFVLPTGCVTAWLVYWNWFDGIAWACVACLYQQRWRLPGNYRIFWAVNFQPADGNCVINCHVIWEM